MLGFTLAIISTIGYSLNQIYNKKLVKNLEPWNSLIITGFFLSFLSLIIALIFGDFSHQINFKIITITLLAGLVGLIGILFLFKSFEKLPLAPVLSIANLQPFVTLILLIILLNQKIKIIQFIIMIIIFLGIFLTIKNKSKFELNKNLYLPLITAICWGTYSFLITYMLEQNINPINIIFYFEVMIFLLTIIYITLNKNIKITKKTFEKQNIKLGFLAGTFTTIGSLFFAFAVTKLNAAIVASITSTQLIFASIFAIFMLNEKLNKSQYFGISIVVLGLILFQLI